MNDAQKKHIRNLLGEENNEFNNKFLMAFLALAQTYYEGGGLANNSVSCIL